MSIVPGSGDSGAPLWITEKGKNSDKNILVAVLKGAFRYNVRYFQPLSMSEIGFAFKLTDKVLGWIRNNMKRYDGD